MCARSFEPYSSDVDPPSDLHGSAEYRRKVAATLVRRGLREAADRAPAAPGDSQRRALTYVDISMRVNGEMRTGSPEPRKTLADFLRDDLELTGTHVGCEHGVCGACTVLIDGGRSARA